MHTHLTRNDLHYYTLGALSRSSHFLLCGHVGAGKTTFVQSLATHLAIDSGVITSPTYGYLTVHEGLYHTKKITFLHIDMYRMEHESSLIEKGIIEQIDMADIVCIERPKWTHHYADTQWRLITITIDTADTTTRIISEQGYTNTACSNTITP